MSALPDVEVHYLKRELEWLCPYTDLQPETRDALLMCAPFARLAPLGPDPHAYGRLVASYWDRRAGDLAIVEHDIVIRPDVVQAFLHCEHDYCAFPYAWTTNIGPALGCTRFRWELMERFPFAAADAAHGTWKQFDYHLIRVELAGRYRQFPHLHLPPVEHLNEKQRLEEPYASLTLDEHLAALGFQRDSETTAVYVEGAFDHPPRQR